MRRSGSWWTRPVVAGVLVLACLAGLLSAPASAAPGVPAATPSQGQVPAAVGLPTTQPGAPAGVPSATGFWQPYTELVDCSDLQASAGFPWGCESFDGWGVIQRFTHWHQCREWSSAGAGYGPGDVVRDDDPCGGSRGAFTGHYNVVAARVWAEEAEPAPSGGPPVIALACQSTLVFTGKPVTCRDAGGVPSSAATQWAWDCGNGQTGSSSSISCTYTTTGRFTVRLDAASDTGQSSARMVITVGRGLRAGVACRASAVVAPARLWCSGAKQYGGGDAAWTWRVSGDSVEGSTSAAMTTTLTLPGVYQVTGCVQDSSGSACAKSDAFSVFSPLKAGGSCQLLVATVPAVAACAATDSGGAAGGKRWSWTVSGPQRLTATGQFPSFTLSAPGVYTVAGQVTDGIQTVRLAPQVLRVASR